MQPIRSKNRRENLVVCILLAFGCAIAPVYFAVGNFLAGGGISDFNIYFWPAARAALDGTVALRYIAVGAGQFVYAPPSLLFLAPFGLVSASVGHSLFVFGSALLFYVAARPILPQGFPAFLALVTPAATWNIYYAQTGFLFGAMWLWAFRGKWAAVSVLALKPHLGVLSVLSLGKWSSVMRVAALCTLMIIASILLFGILPWRAYYVGLFRYAQVVPDQADLFFIQMSAKLAYGWAGWAVFASAAIWLLRKRLDPFTIATAAILISPYSGMYDLTVVSLGFGIMIYRARHRMPTWHRLLAAVAFSSPLIVRFGVWTIPPILLGGLWLLTQYPAAPRLRLTFLKRKANGLSDGDKKSVS